MAVVLVWSGEHYVVDTLLGAAYAVGVVALLARLRPVAARRVTRVAARRQPVLVLHGAGNRRDSHGFVSRQRTGWTISVSQVSGSGWSPGSVR